MGHRGRHLNEGPEITEEVLGLPNPKCARGSSYQLGHKGRDVGRAFQRVELGP